MELEKVKRNLQSVGQACFIRYYRELTASNLTNDQVVSLLRSETTYTEQSCVSRVSHARAIIQAGVASQALALVVEAKRVAPEIKQQARVYLKEIAKQNNSGRGV